MKIYFKTFKDEGGLVWVNSKYKISLRLAGNPKFILQKYVEKYGKEGINKYNELLAILKEIAEEGYSPFVLYLYGHKNAKEKDS